MNSVDTEMLVYLVCPMTGGKLELSKDHTELISRLAGLAFPIQDSVPILRFEQARDLNSMEIDNDNI